MKHSPFTTGLKMTTFMRGPWIALISFLDNTIVIVRVMMIPMMTRHHLRLNRLMRNQRESVAHFVPSRRFLPARNQQSTRQEHHRPRAGIPPPSGFLFRIEDET